MDEISQQCLPEPLHKLIRLYILGVETGITEDGEDDRFNIRDGAEVRPTVAFRALLIGRAVEQEDIRKISGPEAPL